MNVLSLAGVTLVTVDMLATRESVEAVLRRLVICTAGLAALGILQFTTGFDIAELVKIPGLTADGALHFIGERSNFRRVSGTAAHPIEMGVVLALGLPLALHFAAYREAHRRRWQGSGTGHRPVHPDDPVARPPSSAPSPPSSSCSSPGRASDGCSPWP